MMVRLARLPWPCRVEVDPIGTLFQGSALRASSRVGRLALTVNTQSAPAAMIVLAVSYWVCIASY